MSVDSEVADLPDAAPVRAPADAGSPAAPPDGAGPPARRGSAFAALLLRLHFFAGILVAPFLVVLRCADGQADGLTFNRWRVRGHPG